MVTSSIYVVIAFVNIDTKWIKQNGIDVTQHYVYIILIKHTSFTGKGIAYGTEFPFASATTSSTEGPEPGMDIAPPILSLSLCTLEIRFSSQRKVKIFSLKSKET
jgi:hypothetical protein